MKKKKYSDWLYCSPTLKSILFLTQYAKGYYCIIDLIFGVCIERLSFCGCFEMCEKCLFPNTHELEIILW